MKDDVPIKFKLADTEMKKFDIGKIMPLFQELGFKSLIDKLPKELSTGSAPGQQGFNFGGETKNQSGRLNLGYILVDDEKTFNIFIAELKKQKIFAVDSETSGLDPFSAEMLGSSYSWEKGKAHYVTAKPEFLKKLKPVLEDEKIQKVGHNIKFDIEVFS